jgi:nitroreductase
MLYPLVILSPSSFPTGNGLKPQRGGCFNHILNQWLTTLLAIVANCGWARHNTLMLNDRSSLLTFLQTRKSASAKAMGGPGPTPEQVNAMLHLAVRVPDHGKLTPWRFVIFAGEARARVGDRFSRQWASLNPEHGPDILAFQRGLFMRAPVVCCVVSSAQPHVKIPLWEQQMSAGAVCFNLELAAMAMGFDVQWQTDWVAYDPVTKAAMGLVGDEQVAGLIYIGTTRVELEDRPRPDAAALTTHWSP